MNNKNPTLSFRIMCVTFLWVIPLVIYSALTKVPLYAGNTILYHYVFLFFVSGFCAIEDVRGVTSSFLQLIASSVTFLVFIWIFLYREFSYYWLVAFLFNTYLVFLNYLELHENNRIETLRFTTKALNITVVATIGIYSISYLYLTA